MYIIRIAVFILFLTPFSIGHVYSQKLEQIDSLKHELTKSGNPDTLQVHLLLEISMKYQSFQTDSAMTYVLASLEKAENIGFVQGRADALLHIGRLKRDQNNDAEALDNMFTALKLYRQIDDRVQIANSLNDISIIYANSGDFKKSLEYFTQALEIFQQMGDEKGESYALNNIGLIYQALEDEVSAKKYFILSLKLKEKNHDVYGISRGYSNLGSIAQHNKQWKEALSYYFKADSMYEKTHDLLPQATNLLAISNVNISQGKLAEAEQYSIRALEKAKIVKSLSTQLSACQLLATLEEKQNNLKSALSYQKLYNELADSLNNENHLANLDELKAKFNFEEKEREIALLKKDKDLQEAILARKNIIAYALSGGIVFMIVIVALLFYVYRTTRHQKNTLTIKNEEISQQNDDLDKLNKEKDRFFSILSHDLKGPLNSLKGLSYLLTISNEGLTPDELLQLRAKIDTSLDNLTELINNVLEWSMATSQKRKWSFVKINATEVIQKNISLYQNIAESKGVNLLYKQEGDVFGFADYQAINTVVRNLLSNSIKYSHLNQDIVIRARREEKSILISVKDQGVGITQEILDKLFTLSGTISQPGTNNEKGTGLGLTLCMELMKENNGHIYVKSKVGEGSEFIVTMPESV